MTETELSSLLDTGGVLDDLGVLFANRGFKLYLVGGPVRDLLLRREPKDLDFSTDATPEETKAILAPVATHMWLQGERFGTIGAEVADLAVEITTFRAEAYEPGSRKPTVVFGKDVVEDLRRRDFRMNAMAIELPSRKLIDPFGGAEDVTNRRVRTVNDDATQAFTDDPLRMLRVFRFAAQLGFHVSDELLSYVEANRHLIRSISNERVRDEISKLIVAKHPSRALRLMDKCKLLELVIPELTALKIEQDAEHKHKDIFSHTLAVMEKTPRQLELRLTAIFHDCAKPDTRKIDPELGVSFHGHDVLGAEKARKRLKALKYPNEVIDTVCDIIKLHHRSHTFKMGWTDAAVRRYVHEVGELRPMLHAFVRADCTTKNAKRAQNLQSIMNALEKRIIEVAEKDEEAALRPPINGHRVMQLIDVKGPEVGAAMRFLMDLRLDEGIVDPDEAEKRLIEWNKTRVGASK